VFKVTSDGTETVLHTFRDGSDGCASIGQLFEDGTGNLYGTTAGGGSGGGYGTVFKLAPDGTETVLYSFRGGRDGAAPQGGLIPDKAGNLYGTTYVGGGAGCGGNGCGTVFKLATDGTETVLFRFGNPNKGYFPWTGLLAGKNGLLYGTATSGGINNNGVVFSVRK
jgi:uncharacterized repeat protein (TIGR03803 family)